MRLSKSCLNDKEITAVAKVLEHEFLGMGTEVKLFEEAIVKYLNTDRDVVCVNTGTSALHTALLAIDIKPGDEILVPSITYVACYQAIAATGAVPVACDILEDSIFISKEDAKSRITRKTRAIMPVHYASDSSGMHGVYELAKEFNLRVIEDAAHSFGTIYKDKKVGCTGDIVCFSFDGIKNITSGEGGAIVSGDKEVIAKAKDIRLLGVQKDTDKRYAGDRSWEFNVTGPGLRYHMSNIMAAIGIEQLKKADIFLEKKQELLKYYLELFQDMPGIELLKLDYDNIFAHIFVIKIKDNKRNFIRAKLTEHGIQTGLHYFPNHLLDYFKTDYKLSVAENVYNEILTLPFHYDLTRDEQFQVAILIREYMNS